MTFKCIGIPSENNRPPLTIRKKNGPTIATKVKIADTPVKQVMGLMFRPRLEEGEAMLFSFKRPRRIGIHMLFMRAPIDAIFLDEEKRIVELKEMKPWRDMISVEEVMFVVETAPGTIKQAGIEKGNELEIAENESKPSSL